MRVMTYPIHGLRNIFSFRHFSKKGGGGGGGGGGGSGGSREFP